MAKPCETDSYHVRRLLQDGTEYRLCLETPYEDGNVVCISYTDPSDYNDDEYICVDFPDFVRLGFEILMEKEYARRHPGDFE